MTPEEKAKLREAAIQVDKALQEVFARLYVNRSKLMKKPDPKVKKVLHEWKAGELHSGSKQGPKVTSMKQAVAIALSEARKAKGNK